MELVQVVQERCKQCICQHGTSPQPATVTMCGMFRVLHVLPWLQAVLDGTISTLTFLASCILYLHVLPSNVKAVGLHYWFELVE